MIKIPVAFGSILEVKENPKTPNKMKENNIAGDNSLIENPAIIKKDDNTARLHIVRMLITFLPSDREKLPSDIVNLSTI